MKKPHTRIAVQREPFHGDRFLFLLTHFHDAPGLVSRGRMALERVTPENEMQMPDPTFHLSPEEAQHLLDELWRQGLRPTNAVNEQSALPYIQSHLEDMRRLVFETPQGRVEVREDHTLSPEMMRFFGKLKKLDDETRIGNPVAAPPCPSCGGHGRFWNQAQPLTPDSPRCSKCKGTGVAPPGSVHPIEGA